MAAGRNQSLQHVMRRNWHVIRNLHLNSALLLFVCDIGNKISEIFSIIISIGISEMASLGAL